jgi:hypothetical protein
MVLHDVEYSKAGPIGAILLLWIVLVVCGLAQMAL